MVVTVDLPTRTFLDNAAPARPECTRCACAVTRNRSRKRFRGHVKYLGEGGGTAGGSRKGGERGEEVT